MLSHLDAPPKRAHHDLVYEETGKRILMTGGSTPVNDGQSFTFFNDLWSYDGKAWSRIGEFGDKRSGIRMAYDTSRKRLFSFGGYSGSGSLGDLRMMGSSGWGAVVTKDEMRAAEPGFVYDSARNRLVAFGGSSGRGQLHGATWEWVDSEWKRFGGPGPDARQAHAMVYDSKRRVTVVFGGSAATPGVFLDDTWEFDGKTWTKATATGPVGRASCGFAYDEARGQVVIFGGVAKGGFVGDTWGWDGKEWKKLAETGPAKRAMGYMAYDKSRRVTVLFGGRLGWPNDANDTWEWDGARWTQKG